MTMPTKKNYTIIGCGYVGLRVAKSWIADGHTVTALTRSEERAAEFREIGIRPILGDVLDQESLNALPEADLCLYAVGYDRSASADKRTVYVEGFKNVLDATGTKTKRWLHISSTSVYGQQSGEWVSENSPTEPISEGGKICFDAEKIFSSHPEISNGTILRLGGIYGPDRLIARTTQLMSGTPLSGNPLAWLNLIHVDDIVATIRKMAEMPASDLADLYLLSDDRPITRHEFYYAISKRIGASNPEFETLSGEEQALLTLNKRCRNTKVKNDLEIDLIYGDIQDGLRSALPVDQ